MECIFGDDFIGTHEASYGTKLRKDLETVSYLENVSCLETVTYLDTVCMKGKIST